MIQFFDHRNKWSDFYTVKRITRINIYKTINPTKNVKHEEIGVDASKKNNITIFIVLYFKFHNI